MKNFLYSVVCAMVLNLVFLSPILAHDLIPKELQEYIKENPSATPQEIKAFVDAQNPEFAKNFKTGEEILNIVQNRETTLFDNAFDFLKLGVEHILGGLDHILFVLSLLLIFLFT